MNHMIDCYGSYAPWDDDDYFDEDGNYTEDDYDVWKDIIAERESANENCRH